MRQRADFHDHDARPPIDQSASLVRLLASLGAGTREALWAAQLIERKAAVARWRSGQAGQDSAHSLQRDKRRRT